MKHTILFISIAISLTGCNLFDRADPPRPDDDGPPEDMTVVDMVDLSDETPDILADMTPDLTSTDMQTDGLNDMGDMLDDMPDLGEDMADMGELCGNGKLDGDERCDDANNTDKDGCSATCAIEDGWVCPVVIRSQSCARVTGVGHSDKVKIASPTLPKQGSDTGNINCPSPSFVIAVQGSTDTRDGIGRTSVQCADLDVALNGAITQTRARSLNDFIELPSHAAFDAVNCPADTFLSGVTVYYDAGLALAREVTGIQLQCNALAIKDGKLTRLNSSAARMIYGQMGEKSYSVDCEEGDVVTGFLADIQPQREGDFLNRLSLRCTTASLLTK